MYIYSFMNHIECHFFAYLNFFSCFAHTPFASEKKKLDTIWIWIIRKEIQYHLLISLLDTQIQLCHFVNENIYFLFCFVRQNGINSNSSGNGNSSESANVASDETEDSNYENSSMAKLRNKNESQGALHHQCIDELTSHIRTAQQQRVVETVSTPDVEEKKLQSSSRSETPTSFVTVIEVKDSSPNCSSPTPAPSSITNATGEVAVISSPSHSLDDSSISETLSRSDESVISTVQNLEVKRKIPPR